MIKIVQTNKYIKMINSFLLYNSKEDWYEKGKQKS